jgi:hypothetical protein
VKLATMGKELRKHPRRAIDCELAISWQDSHGDVRSLRARGLDLSDSGARIETTEAIEVGSCVYVRAEEYGIAGSAHIRHATRRGSKYVIGLELHELSAEPGRAEGRFVDFYSLLQIGPGAEQETIQRVYRMLVARYHPDNAHTGNLEKFLLLRRAYETLSDPQKRAAYDSEYHLRQEQPIAVFELREFLEGIDAEANRRLGMLTLLYSRRRMDTDRPGLSLLELERLMAIPREHLTFTVWFLKEKSYLRVGANSDYQITAEGVEFLERHIPSNRTIHRLLAAAETDIGGPAAGSPSAARDEEVPE